MSKLASGKLDGSDANAFGNFIIKLGQDDTTRGLHIEPMKNAVDSRVRTGRVTDRLRAVLIKMKGPTDSVYVVHGVWDHDEAIRIAERLHAEVNPINGQVMITEIQVQEPAPSPLSSSDSSSSSSYSYSSSSPSPSSSSSSLDAESWATEKYSWLGAVGYTEASLFETFGVPPKAAAAAMEAETQDELLDVAASYPGWVSDVLLGLAAGDSPTIIKETLELMRQVPEDTSADEAILDALETNIGKSAYTVVEGEEELRQVLEDGTLAEWRVFLHPEQRKYATQRYKGPFRLSGAAGTGKTVVLLHRTKKMAQRYPGSRILLTTFTTTLADGLKDQLELLDPSIKTVPLGSAGVAVRGVDSAIAQVVRSNGKLAQEAAKAVLGEARADSHSQLDDRIWEDVLAGVDLSELPPAASSARYLKAEYETVVLPNRITTLDQYLRVRRPGRKVALNRAKRKALWPVIEAYRTEAHMRGGTSFAEDAAIAKACLELSGQTWVDHALIDEGQDLSVLQWQFLRALVKPGHDDLFIADDSQQRIYGPQVVLSRHGVAIVGRSRRLLLSYRTTAQNLGRAIKALEGAEFVGLEGQSVEEELALDAAEIEGGSAGDGSAGSSPVSVKRSGRSVEYRALRNGPVPEEFVADGNEYLEIITEKVREWLDEGEPGGSIGVLVPDGLTARRVTEHLGAAGVKARQIHRSRGSGKQVAVMTMHRAKGLEFVNVVALLPRPMPFESDEDYALQQRSLQYVAMSRARDRLAIVARA